MSDSLIPLTQLLFCMQILNFFRTQSAKCLDLYAFLFCPPFSSVVASNICLSGNEKWMNVFPKVSHQFLNFLLNCRWQMKVHFLHFLVVHLYKIKQICKTFFLPTLNKMMHDRRLGHMQHSTLFTCNWCYFCGESSNNKDVAIDRRPLSFLEVYVVKLKGSMRPWSFSVTIKCIKSSIKSHQENMLKRKASDK